ncbi:Mediator of RNA polymerase II transcription subunit 13 [Acorus calamus]|uniref:Mediator of RNA polymerase II transcription subunit 13 n=1 Tax=Acorus calamus TaxID=4465 RepID=A0AAV9EF82_ACOCL|nr:Mediator of RNA polymerase II transcription subunit 13 [Acorus calamus]
MECQNDYNNNEFFIGRLMGSGKGARAEHKDAATLTVLSSHLQLQNEGFLSTWTNSFVGPWDPSQGVYNPDEKIKLWLFLPGRHSSIVGSAQAAVSKLRIVGAGIWSAPGDSEEIASALSQALRNRIERALRGVSYVRFGDVFVKCHSSTQGVPSALSRLKEDCGSGQCPPLHIKDLAQT